MNPQEFCKASVIVLRKPVILSRVQFGFVVSFHIIFPAFTIGLAAWLATIEGTRLATGNATVSTNFDVPSGMETGASSLVVVANGIPSNPVSVTVN